ncbi:hypothetical protein M8C21_014937 [Ambrosia artemisiifolia]|uniref:Uncharacterized protein n=1 Tax=Ambrosia artemisiifolia TaxID=4212 RepID=A0AAD5C6F9_AMBAR|nr:hypothetical protein M8C21_014937 [Ambrosia artemisiifolia]
MNKINALVLFLIVITCTCSSVSCTSSNNDDQNIAMVVNNDQTPTIKMTIQADFDPIEFGRLILKRPAANCYGIDEDCSWSLLPCCEGLYCSSGTCVRDTDCYPQGTSCNLIGKPCCWPLMCSKWGGGGTCSPR